MLVVKRREALNNIDIYVINLKQDIEKKMHMKKLCKENSLQCHFVDAVYGKNLTEDNIEQVYSKKKAIHEFGRELTKGEIGCALSHLSVYKEIVEKNIEMAIIVEDDIVIEDGFLELLNSVDTFPKMWECILLGHYRFSFRKLETASSYWERVRINDKYEVVRLMEHAYGTHGYLINKKGAIKLIEAMSILSKPVDVYTGDEKVFNMYAISPPCITLEPVFSLDSNIHKDREKIDCDTLRIIKNDSKWKVLLKKNGLFKIIKSIYEFIFSLRVKFHYVMMKIKQPKKYM